MDIIWICSIGILQENGWGIYHMDIYEVTFNLYLNWAFQIATVDYKTINLVGYILINQIIRC